MIRRRKIILVDDDRKNSQLLMRFIASEGYDVEYAADGRAGLELYREAHPDLILLDVNMPVMDGFELARIIRAMDKRVIIFFLTDRADKVDRLHGFSLKGNDYIPKPFYPEELIAKINERFDSLTADSDAEYKLGDIIFRPGVASITYRGETHSLSVRQCEILSILARNAGSVVEREVILNEVWGDAGYSNSLALNVQITYLRRLLPDPSVTITSIKKKGYLLSAGR